MEPISSIEPKIITATLQSIEYPDALGCPPTISMTTEPNLVGVDALLTLLALGMASIYLNLEQLHGEEKIPTPDQIFEAVGEQFFSAVESGSISEGS